MGKGGDNKQTMNMTGGGGNNSYQKENNNNNGNNNQNNFGIDANDNNSETTAFIKNLHVGHGRLSNNNKFFKSKRKWLLAITLIFIIVISFLMAIFLVKHDHDHHNKNNNDPNTITGIVDIPPPPPPSVVVETGGVDADAKTTTSTTTTTHQDPNSSSSSSSSSKSSSTSSNTITTGCETTLMIMRHCEKYGPEVTTKDGNEHCSYVGYERAQFIPTLFGSGSNGGNNKWPVPTKLYALSAKRNNDHMNYREIETLEPLSNKFGLNIESNNFNNNDDLIHTFFQQLNNGELCNQLVLVSWKHEYIVDLANKLSCPNCPDIYDEMEFDEVWQLKYVYDTIGLLSSTKLQQHQQQNKNKKDDNNNNGKRMLRKKKDNHNNDDGSRLTAATTSENNNNKSKSSTTTTNNSQPNKQWSVYFSKSYQGFDPLKFSNLVGDYNNNNNGDGSGNGGGGGGVGGHWLQQQQRDDNNNGANDEM